MCPNVIKHNVDSYYVFMKVLLTEGWQGEVVKISPLEYVSFVVNFVGLAQDATSAKIMSSFATGREHLKSMENSPFVALYVFCFGSLYGLLWVAIFSPVHHQFLFFCSRSAQECKTNFWLPSHILARQSHFFSFIFASNAHILMTSNDEYVRCYIGRRLGL